MRDKTNRLPNQVWATDITYIKLGIGYAYFATIIDLFSGKALLGRVSNTLDAELCVAALEEAIARHGVPAIFNTEQGCQFTSENFTVTSERHGVRIGMDGVVGRSTTSSAGVSGVRSSMRISILPTPEP